MPTMGIDNLAADVINFMDINNLQDSYILGHSLGGKVSIELSLKNPDRVSGAIIVDVGPFHYPGT